MWWNKTWQIKKKEKKEEVDSWRPEGALKSCKRQSFVCTSTTCHFPSFLFPFGCSINVYMGKLMAEVQMVDVSGGGIISLLLVVVISCPSFFQPLHCLSPLRAVSFSFLPLVPRAAPHLLSLAVRSVEQHCSTSVQGKKNIILSPPSHLLSPLFYFSL